MSQSPVRHCERSEAIQGPQYDPRGLLAPRMLWPLDCFVARAPRNDGWGAAEPIDWAVWRARGRAIRYTGTHEARAGTQRCTLNTYAPFGLNRRAATRCVALRSPG